MKSSIQYDFLEPEWSFLAKKIMTYKDSSACYRRVNKKIYSQQYIRETAEYWQLMSFTQLLVLMVSKEHLLRERENLIISLIGNCECRLGVPDRTFYDKIPNLPANAGVLDLEGVLGELKLFVYLIESKGLRILPPSDFIFTDAVFFWSLPPDEAAAVHKALYLLSRQYRSLRN